MSDYGKYIVIEHAGIEQMVVFNAMQSHADIARALVGVDAPNLVSAGQIRVWPIEGTLNPKLVISCFGESTTLHLRARPNEDVRAYVRSCGIDPTDVYVNEESRG